MGAGWISSRSPIACTRPWRVSPVRPSRSAVTTLGRLPIGWPGAKPRSPHFFTCRTLLGSLRCWRRWTIHRQVIHGDLTGNVLFADSLPPAVIDFVVYWRPAAYARAVVVADALAWEGATPDDLAAATSGEGFGQFLARALMARIVTDWLADADSAPARRPRLCLRRRPCGPSHRVCLTLRRLSMKGAGASLSFALCPMRSMRSFH